MAHKLYKFYWDCGRSGHIEGLFVEDSDVVEKAIGKQVYFGEILGKHSEVYGTLEREEISVVSDNPEVVKIFMDNNISSGYNPIQYLQEE